MQFVKYSNLEVRATRHSLLNPVTLQAVNKVPKRKNAFHSLYSSPSAKFGFLYIQILE
jgi:hypothetical protein